MSVDLVVVDPKGGDLVGLIVIYLMDADLNEGLSLMEAILLVL